MPDGGIVRTCVGAGFGWGYSWAMSAEPGVAERVNLTQAVITSERGDVLLVDDGGWTLPAVETRGHWHAELPPVIEALRRTHGLHAVALRVIDHEYDATARRGRASTPRRAP